jgi:hypothetical protein
VVEFTSEEVRCTGVLHAPNSGMAPASSSLNPNSSFAAEGSCSQHFDSVTASQGRLPKIHFPVFNGDEPQLWRSH